MNRQRPKTGFWFGLVVVIVKPFMLAFTKRDWRGGENLPKSGGFVVVTNHISHFDPVALGHYLYDNGRVPRLLGKASLFKIPVFGRIILKAGMIPVYRGSAEAAHAFTDAVKAVEHGDCVVFYPEGTITRDPDQWPMTGKTGAARVALETGCAVIPVAQWGPQEILPPYSKRLRLLPRKTVHVLAGPPVDLEDLRGRPITSAVLRTATDRILDAITAQLAELRGELPPATRFDPDQAGVPRTGRLQVSPTPPEEDDV